LDQPHRSILAHAAKLLLAIPAQEMCPQLAVSREDEFRRQHESLTGLAVQPVQTLPQAMALHKYLIFSKAEPALSLAHHANPLHIIVSRPGFRRKRLGRVSLGDHAHEAGRVAALACPAEPLAEFGVGEGGAHTGQYTCHVSYKGKPEAGELLEGSGVDAVQ